MSAIPVRHAFHCSAAPDIDVMEVKVADSQTVMFELSGSSVFIEDREQVTLLRDMLTVWLSRPKQ